MGCMRMTELFRLLGTVAIDTSKAETALRDVTQRAEKTESTFSRIGGAAASVGKGIVAAGASIGGALLLATEGTREYRTAMGKLDTAFVVAGHSSETAKNTYSELNAVIGDSDVATEASNHLALLVDNQKDLATWTGDILPGVFATFGDSIPIESLTESSLEVARNGQLTGGLVDALVWAGINEEEFQAKLDACSGEQERQQLIMDTLTGIYGDASAQYKETNKDVMDANSANEKLTDAFAEVARVCEPALKVVKEKVADMVQAALPHIESVIEKIKDGIKWVKENQTTIDAWVAVIIGATVSIGVFLAILNWGKAMTLAANAIKTVRTAVLAFNAALLANPIGIVIALLAGLVAAFIYLWNNNEGFRKFWIDMWEKIKSASGTAVDWIGKKFDKLKEWLGKVKETFGGIKDTITEKINGARDAVDKAVQKIKGFFPLSIGKIFSNLKIPSITVSGGKAPYGIAGKGSLPSFDVKWNAEGGIIDKATIFGMTKNGTLLGGGESGKEAIAPIDTLRGYVRDSVRKENELIVKAIIEQNRALIAFLRDSMPKAVVLDSGAMVGEMIPMIDTKLSDRMEHSKRGNTR